MKELTAIGTSKFLPGFALAGVKTKIAGSDDVVQTIRECEGVVVVEGPLFDSVPEEEHHELRASVDPVVIPLSEDEGGEMERLRSMIRTTLGVDLLK